MIHLINLTYARDLQCTFYHSFTCVILSSATYRRIQTNIAASGRRMHSEIDILKSIILRDAFRFKAL